jgi:choice-of-anchor B domain-containing protein
MIDCALLLFLAPLSFSGEDTSPHPVFPAPRASGVGSVPFTASGVQLVGWKPLTEFAGNNVSGNDCWGYTAPSGREYALIGLSNGTGFVEVTDPGLPTIVAFKSGVASLWRGIKTYSTFAYVVSEGGDGIQVFDLSAIDSGTVTLAATVTAGGTTTATHTVAIDEVSGFLYRAGGGSHGIRIYSLANPALPAFVGEWNTLYVHECQAVTWDLAGPYLGRQIVFAYAGSSGLVKILDVTNKAAITEIASVPYTGAAYSHQGWLSASKQQLYLDDELDDGSFGGARTRIFDLTNLAAPSYVGFFGGVAASIDHNLYVKGNRIYEANYRSGLRIFDATNPLAPVASAYFDTYPESDAQLYNSLWSNYPFFASGTIIGSDVEKGLFVWREGAAGLVFDFPSGVPERVDPQGGALFFRVEPVGTTLVPGSVTLHWSTGGAFTSVAATALGNDDFTAALPGFACGQRVDFYVSASGTDGITWSDPPAAPTQVHIARASYAETSVFVDTLESASGWLASAPGDTATSGFWVRVDPVGTDAQPEDDHSVPGSQCWVTGQGVPGGAVGDADLDGGVATLRSPILDASGLSDPRLAYWRWWSNRQNIFAIDDSFRVDLSNDGGASWVNVETLEPAHVDGLGGWVRHELRIADFLAPTAVMQLRFRAEDIGGGSIVEAAIDDLELFDPDCTSVALTAVTPATGSFDGGEIVTLTGSGFGASTSVSFGSNPATAVNFVNATTLLVRVPRAIGPVGGKTGRLSQRVDVTVATPGTDTLTGGYTYQLKQKSP